MLTQRLIFQKVWPPRTVQPPSHLDLRCHASTIVELQNGDFLAAWWEGSYETADDVVVSASRLKHGSESWSEPFVLADTYGKPEGNPVLFVSPNGRAWLFYMTMFGKWWNTCKIKYKTSEDDGYTWSNPAFLVDRIGLMLRNKPITLSSGRIVLPIYNESSIDDKENNYSLMLLSDDEGKNWRFSEPIRSSPPNLQPSVIERSDGSLLAYCRYYVYPVPGKEGRIWQSISKTAGESWSVATRSLFQNPNAGIDMVKTFKGNVVLAFNDSTEKRNPLAIALSEDNGLSWSFKRTMESDPGTFDYPAIIQSRESLIHLTYSYNHLSIKHVTFDEDWVQG